MEACPRGRRAASHPVDRRHDRRRLHRHGSPAQPGEGHPVVQRVPAQGSVEGGGDAHLGARAHRDDAQADARVAAAHADRALHLLRGQGLHQVAQDGRPTSCSASCGARATWSRGTPCSSRFTRRSRRCWRRPIGRFSRRWRSGCRSGSWSRRVGRSTSRTSRSARPTTRRRSRSRRSRGAAREDSKDGPAKGSAGAGERRHLGLAGRGRGGAGRGRGERHRSGVAGRRAGRAQRQWRGGRAQRRQRGRRAGPAPSDVKPND